MKRITYILTLAAVTTVWAVDNPTRPRSPISGSGTQPVTSYKSGLTQAPNPLDTTGNDIITGNVTGGRHFRGIVPYRATSDFGGELSSNSFDNFLRRSAGSQSYMQHQSQATPFYSPSATVTKIQPGQQRLNTSPYVSQYQAPYLSEMAGTAQRQDLRIDTQPYRVSENVIPRPLSGDDGDLEKQIRRHLRSRYPTLLDDMQDMNAVQPETLVDTRVKAEPYQPLRTDVNIPRSYSPEQLRKPYEAQSSETAPQQPAKSTSTIDVYDQMKQQIDELALPTDPNETDSAKMREMTEKLTQLGQRSLEVQKILQGHKTFASYADDKFNTYMRAGETFLKEGEYYRAADAYTLAMIYKSNDPLASIGKGHALFAAGEYMSSALFLSRGIEMFPDYLHFKIDLTELIPDKDAMERRLTEIQQWLVNSGGAPQLRFLLAYVYYQLGRYDVAKDHIREAGIEMPDSMAAAILKIVIYDAAK